MKHRGTSTYYDSLLDKEAQKTNMKMLVDAAEPHQQIGLPAALDWHGSGGVRPPCRQVEEMLALEDRVEGDPEPKEAEEEGEREQRKEKEEENVAHTIDDFEPSTFVRTIRLNKVGPRQGQYQQAWQAQCPFQRDTGDHPATFSRRAMACTCN